MDHEGEDAEHEIAIDLDTAAHAHHRHADRDDALYDFRTMVERIDRTSSAPGSLTEAVPYEGKRR